MNEFKKWCPQLKVLRLHSLDKDEQVRLRKSLSDPNIAQVVVTTYDTLKTGGLSHSLRSLVWRCVFLDEGHRIKNENSDVSKACHGLRARFRVVLTGTPVQNNLHEFGALLKFLAPNIFTDLELFDPAFNLKVSRGVHRSPRKLSRGSAAEPISSGDGGSGGDGGDGTAGTAQQIDRALLASAHFMMKPFVLRRLKSEVEQKLPPKYETKINCPMTELQRELTRALLFKEQALLSKLDGEDCCDLCFEL
jgi:SWI/SNF-related matrix-associated actin-dependent regulator of chromatin subfamily A member 5